MPQPKRRPRPVFDADGYRIFSEGEPGQLHVAAHRFLETERFAAGCQLLGEWLDDHGGEGPKWIHLQWHQIVFELAVEQWHTAHQRFCRFILPIAVESDGAVTDAPQAMLRLCIEAPADAQMQWNELGPAALRRLIGQARPFQRLHDAVALTGARELDALDWWLTRRADHAPDGLCDAIRGVMCFGLKDYEKASELLLSALPYLGDWGGSRAQNALFVRLAKISRRRAAGADLQKKNCLAGTAAAAA